VTNSLQSNLCSKNSYQFWKTWKSKFIVLNKPPFVDGLTDPASIADLFAMNMQKLYTPILAAREEELKSHITTRLDSIEMILITLEYGNCR